MSILDLNAIEVADGGVLQIELQDFEQFDQIKQQVDQLFKNRNVLVIFSTPKFRIKVTDFSEQFMNQHGWFRQ